VLSEKIPALIKYRKKIKNSSCINFFYKEVFNMEENEEVVLTEEMEKEFSNGKGEE
jgi:hypothetical protein